MMNKRSHPVSTLLNKLDLPLLLECFISMKFISIHEQKIKTTTLKKVGILVGGEEIFMLFSNNNIKFIIL